MNLKRMSWRHKNNKLLYYSVNLLRQLLPVSYYNSRLLSELEKIDSFDLERVNNRVNYYNKLEDSCDLPSSTGRLSDLKMESKKKTYFFDLYEYARYFKQTLKLIYLFGDIVHIPDDPSFVKSRPISDKNANSVVLKWGKIRHFIFIKKDSYEFSEKTNILLGRGKVKPRQTHRARFMEKYYNHPMCNVGKVNDPTVHPEWNKDRMTIEEHLKYKFILCLEGNDVASNLKWVMSSNSLAVMPKPKFETWFMEGTLIPDYHYVLINDDYSNLEEKMIYYINNHDKAEQIVENAHKYVAQFKNKRLENLISLLVLKKYFVKTNQLSESLNLIKK
ncbi:glycosyl transferase family 90 [Ancylomarina sp. 16SWW S1-10-2]|uniref:glycosyl transferase family 90 n=1 Tax=Ancylomarina sp. 16SWW S1-10-2 TaxID=2499681 RepID=UPI0012AE251D|nr:glycosyl transferase family 90 [Ancylomarina sp. 16SWW S1-10-2]MRT94259.1 lipopolysaccharide biosynthesis protein [Ancylomarina sp. 16SWW S1-10-2]